MARVCEVCGKGNQIGNMVEIRGKAKYLGGVGTKITGISRRKFKANLQNVHVTLPSGGNKMMRVCTSCLRGGAVQKAVQSKPFVLPIDKSGKASRGKTTAAAPGPAAAKAKK
jgi:large subunit ribosomal protein L28